MLGIREFPLKQEQGAQMVTMPPSAQVLGARERGEQIFVWAFVDVDDMRLPTAHYFEVFAATPSYVWPVPSLAPGEYRRFLGIAAPRELSVVPTVFHVFERLHHPTQPGREHVTHHSASRPGASS